MTLELWPYNSPRMAVFGYDGATTILTPGD